MSEAQTVTIADFLMARLNDDERTAHRALDRPGPGHNEAPGGYGGWWLGHYQHARRFDPARILAECEAKRRIVETHRWAPNSVCALNPEHDCYEPGEHDRAVEVFATLRFLALPYVDHPDYNPDWRP